jgi:signal transduction histidine kinase
LIRFPELSRQERTAEYLREKYANTPINLVLCFGFPALQFWQQYGPRLFPSAAVLFMGVETRRLNGFHMGLPVAGLTITFEDRKLLELALRLHPKTRHVFLAGGSTEFERYWMAERLKALHGFQANVGLEDLSSLPLPRLQQRLSHLPGDSVVLFQDLYRDAAGRYLQGDEGVHLVCKWANAPVYGFYADYLGKGLVGGRVLDIDIGPRAARLAMRLLSGESASSVGVQAADQNRYFFDSRGLKRWHIDENRLPEGSVVLFKEQSFWQLYKGRVILAALFCSLETALIIGLFAQLARRKRADFMVQRLTGELVSAQEEERARISRDLHDDLGQQLAIIGLGLSNLERQLAGSATPVHEKIAQLEERVFILASGIRHLSHELHPAVLDHAGLAAALRTHCSEFSAVSGIRVTTAIEPDRIKLPPEISLCLYRVSQESLRNVMKHSGATHVHLVVRGTEHEVGLTLEDNGTGFDAAERAQTGIGLFSMAERVKLLHGSFQVESRPNSGTVVRVRVPLRKAT